MSHLDICYRAFKKYRKITLDDASCERERRAIAVANKELDKLEATKYLCKIEEDWIAAIEEGLTFVEKAVAEERQFIRSDGEVVPIEKVKKISKDTVVHLAKHSDLITHIPEEEGADVVPDKLYMVEKLSDYAVYENRFLYMLLCYLDNFINFRLEKIETLRRTYNGNLSVSKEIVSKKRKLTINSSVVEEREDNPYPIADEKSAASVQRIKDCQSIITSLLNTDLMMQVAKSPMLKPPITKTNVLKMNNNFKRALALYDYVATYKGLGFTYEAVHYDYTPFTDKIADEIAESANLVSFLSFMYGNNIEDLLERTYKEEEQRRKDEEAKKLDERIKKMKKRALESNRTMEEYMVLLEQRNRQLEKNSEELMLLRQEVEKLNHAIDDINREKDELNRRNDELTVAVEEKDRKIAELNQKYIEDMAESKRLHDAEVEGLNSAHEQDIAELKDDFNQQLQASIDGYEQQITGFNAQIDELKEKNEGIREEFEHDILVLNEKVNDSKAALKAEQERCGAEIARAGDVAKNEIAKSDAAAKNEIAKHQAECERQIKDVEREREYIRAELNGLRAKNGLLTPSEDYTSRERFVELEADFKAFKKFFKGQWKLTKKAIKQEVKLEQEQMKKEAEVAKEKAEKQATEPQNTENSVEDNDISGNAVETENNISENQGITENQNVDEQNTNEQIIEEQKELSTDSGVEAEEKPENADGNEQ